MKELDFNPHKSKEEFRNNYKLHDLAEMHGKNLLVQWGIDFQEFGQDLRYQKLWEMGKDKPDLIVTIHNKKLLLDWKGKHNAKWLLNKRAFDSYKVWSDKLSLNVIIAFFVFDSENKLIERRFAVIDKHVSKESPKKQWDKNTTVEFTDELPDFTKANLIKYCL